jgi:hypothetical protein
LKKGLFVLLIILSGFSFFILTANSQEDMQFINNVAFDNPQRSAAVFKHDEHNEQAQIESCNECHHVYDDNGNLLEDESSEDLSCSECHELEHSEKKPDLMKAFHRNCKECHRQKKKGPLMCGQCHVRRPEIQEISG